MEHSVAVAIWVATSSETSEMKPAILYDDMLPLVSLWLIADSVSNQSQADVGQSVTGHGLIHPSIYWFTGNPSVSQNARYWMGERMNTPPVKTCFFIPDMHISDFSYFKNWWNGAVWNLFMERPSYIDDSSSSSFSNCNRFLNFTSSYSVWLNLLFCWGIIV